MINIYDWACCKEMTFEEKAERTGRHIYNMNWKVINNDLCITTDFLMYIVAELLNIEVSTANKIIWKMIYTDRLEVEHGKRTFSKCSQYGARYGSGEHYYSIY